MEISVPPQEGLPWVFTEKPVTAWGGLRLIQEMLLRMKFRDVLRESGLPEPGSNRGFDPVVMMETFMVCVWAGGVRFSHTGLVRFDEALRTMFGWKKVASTSTFTRFFRRFDREQVDEVFGRINRWFWEQMPSQTLTLDLDSSVVVRYGEQEGTAVGYNPTKQGRRSHQPLFAFVADIRMVLHAWMRAGNVGAGNGTEVFFNEAEALLGKRHRIGLVRADAGFYDGDFLGQLEGKEIDYVVAAKLHPPLKHRIMAERNWIAIGDGIAVAEFEHSCIHWKRSRRFIAVRQEKKVRPNALGKELFEVPGYLFQAYVTSLRLSPGEIWKIYRGRGDSENRIAELKHDFGMSGFCLDSFYGTEAAFRTVILAYNLMSVFRQALLQAPKAVRLSTMRFQCFALGSWVGREGRSRVIRISLARERRPWFTGLFERIEGLGPPWPVSVKA
jgi:hypothetical protein